MASKARMLDTNRTAWTFGQSLDWHLERGTRPAGTPESKGAPWGNKEFANAVGAAKSAAQAPSERTIRNWRNGDTLPDSPDFSAVVMALFGGKSEYVDWRQELTDKYHATRAERDASGGAADDPVRTTAPVHRASIPTRPLRCLGRDEDLKSVVGALTGDRDQTTVLVLGGPGMGKTTLTRQAANDVTVALRFGNRRWFVELETAPDAQALETAIVAALGLDPATMKFEGALAQLAQAPGLLLLDNLETPWDGERSKVEALLARLHHMPTLTLLASLRGNEPPAGLRWSRQRTMHPLEWPHDRDLFLDIAQDIRPDDPQLAPLLMDLGGVPLAIELVAMQAAAHDSLAAIHAEWQRAGVRLALRRGVEPSRLTSLEKSLELSFDSPRLGDPGRRLFGILGQLPAGMGTEDLNALFGDTAFEARQSLLSSGLTVERGGRLDLLPPVRDHARRHHVPNSNEDTLWSGHFLALAHAGHTLVLGVEGGNTIRRIAADLPNLESAIRVAIANQALKPALATLRVIVNTMARTGLGTTAVLEDLAEACRAADDLAGEATCVDASGFVSLHRSDHDAARTACERALTLYRKIGSIHGEASCIHRLGDIALQRSDHHAARTAYEQALLLYRKVGDILGEANCIRSLGDIALDRSDRDAARSAYEQVLPLFRQVGSVQGEANCIARLGDVALALSDHDAARAACEQALPLYQKIGDILGEAHCIKNLGEIALRRADYEAARQAYTHAQPLYRQVGSIRGEADCIRSLGDIALARSDREAARKSFNEALALYERIQEPHSIGLTHARLAQVATGNVRERHLTAARSAWESINRPDLVALLEE